MVQQLTRYYDSLLHNRPFSEQINYSLPIRLLAISSIFHAHNFIDQKYHRLSIEFWQFKITKNDLSYWLHIENLERKISSSIEIPLDFHSCLKVTETEDVIPPNRVIGRPPSALRKQIDRMPPEKAEIILAIRYQILEFHDQIREVGRTTSIQYGLAKGEKEVYKTKLCAEFRRDQFNSWPVLYLVLPYLKRAGRYKARRVKDLTWAQINLWTEHKNFELLFIAGSQKRGFGYSYNLSRESYARQCEQLLGYLPNFRSHADLVALALQEWRQAHLPDAAVPCPPSSKSDLG